MASFLMLLAILTGTWEARTADSVFVETWAAPRAGMILGNGQEVSGDRTVFFEFLRIEEREDGVVYVAQPKGGAPTEFPLVDSGDGRFVFENPAHDHPRRITYVVGQEEMQVTLEGTGPTTTLRFRRLTAGR